MGGRGGDANTNQSESYWQRQAERTSGNQSQGDLAGAGGVSAEELQELADAARQDIEEQDVIRDQSIDTLANWTGNPAEMPPQVVQEAVRQLMAQAISPRPIDLPASILQQIASSKQPLLLLPGPSSSEDDQTPLNPATGAEYGVVSPSELLTTSRTGGDTLSTESHLVQDIIPPTNVSPTALHQTELVAAEADVLRDQVATATTISADVLEQFRSTNTIMKISEARAFASQLLGPNAGDSEFRDLANLLLQPIPTTVDTSNITFVDYMTPRAGATYPFLDGIDRRWRIIGIKAGTSKDEVVNTVTETDRFGMQQATFFYVKDGRVEYLFVDGMNTEEFLKATGLELHQEKKGDYVLSKRFSRIMRPYYATKTFDTGIGTGEGQIDIHRFSEGEMPKDVEQVWDGAGVIDRRVLEKILIPKDVSDAKRAQLMRELRHAQRVEFTIMTNEGQEKGHAIVGDNLEHDIMLREDIKGEVRLTNDTVWLGINFVHHHEHLRLDVQSLINMGHTNQEKAFITTDMVMQRIEEEGQLLKQSVETGEVATVMGRIDRYTSEAKLDSWPMRKAYALGAHPMWFPSWVRGTFNQGIEGLKAQEEKDKFPFHGGRFYLMCDEVARFAGHDIHVKPGEVYLSPDHSTAYVNRDDWVMLHDTNANNPNGIRDILGGADQDDAAVCIPFTDKSSNERFIHIRRNPNQDDEYINLKPSQDSADLPWKTTNGLLSYPVMDKNNLPLRKDNVTGITYREDLIDSDPNNVPGRGIEGWTREGMQAAAARAELNEGVVGVHCNGLMVHKAVFDGLPSEMPAATEDVVDGVQKNGSDCSAIKEYWRGVTMNYVQRQIPVPKYLQNRLGLPRNAPRPPVPQNHWYDQLHEHMQTHTAQMEKIRDEMANQAMPPVPLLDKAFEESAEMSRTPGKTYMDIATSLNEFYKTALDNSAKERRGIGRSGRNTVTNYIPEDYDYAAQATYQELVKYHPDDHTPIVRVQMLRNAVGETKNDRKSDRMLWTNGPQKPDGSFQQGWSDVSFRALQETGNLNAAYIDGKHGLYTYPGAVQVQANLHTVGAKNMWYNLLKMNNDKAGKPTPTIDELKNMQVVSPNKRGLISAADYHKRQFTEWVKNGSFRGKEVQIQQITEQNNPLGESRHIGRHGIFSPDGRFLGLQSKDADQHLSQGRYKIGVGFTAKSGEDFRFTLEPISEALPTSDPGEHLEQLEDISGE